ncbi:MAG: cyclic nucleotide-binding domain-containing protein, partial [Betaproteobacteria bacterium]|nr:cyclic nucleotide-binding domain-containing protein [Betaproteobacteria bacterium]
MSARPPQLAHLEHLGDAARFATQLHALIPQCMLLENFTSEEVRELAQFMEVFRAPEGVEVIREGDGGDFMVMVIEGRVEVSKRDRWNTPQPIATVEPGRILGEMSMIDGAARFATCTAAGGPALVAVLSRENLART